MVQNLSFLRNITGDSRSLRYISCNTVFGLEEADAEGLWFFFLYVLLVKRRIYCIMSCYVAMCRDPEKCKLEQIWGLMNLAECRFVELLNLSNIDSKLCGWRLVNQTLSGIEFKTCFSGDKKIFFANRVVSCRFILIFRNHLYTNKEYADGNIHNLNYLYKVAEIIKRNDLNENLLSNESLKLVRSGCFILGEECRENQCFRATEISRSNKY